MKPISLTDEYLEDIIDSAVIENEQVTFITDGLVTDKILSYALTEYDLSDEESDFEIFDDEDYIVYTIPSKGSAPYSIVVKTVESDNGFRNVNHDGICYVQEYFCKNDIYDYVDADEIVFFKDGTEKDDESVGDDEYFLVSLIKEMCSEIQDLKVKQKDLENQLKERDTYVLKFDTSDIEKEEIEKLKKLIREPFCNIFSL